MSNSLTILPDIDQALKNEVTQRHSYFQLKYFLIGKEPTNQAKMWQCLRELKARRDALESMSLEAEETRDRIELCDIRSEKIGAARDRAKTDLARREWDVKLRRTDRERRAAEEAVRALEDRRRATQEEARFLLDTFNHISAEEPLRPFDDLAAQKSYWDTRLAAKLNLKMLSGAPVDPELLETIMALPDDVPIKGRAVHTLRLRHASMMRQLQQSAAEQAGEGD